MQTGRSDRSPQGLYTCRQGDAGQREGGSTPCIERADCPANSTRSSPAQPEQRGSKQQEPRNSTQQQEHSLMQQKDFAFVCLEP
jgi:hypothetical protein